jgi:hypothetical protein
MSLYPLYFPATHLASSPIYISPLSVVCDRLCGLVVRVLGYRSGGPVSIPDFLKKVVCLERGLLSLVSTTEELLDRKVAAPVYKTENTAVYLQELAITSPTSGGLSVGIVRSRTQTMEFFLSVVSATLGDGLVVGLSARW